MGSRRMRRDAFRGLTLIQPEHRICGTADLESLRFLEIRAFEKLLRAGQFVQIIRGPNQRATDMWTIRSCASSISL